VRGEAVLGEKTDPNRCRFAAVSSSKIPQFAHNFHKHCFEAASNSANQQLCTMKVNLKAASSVLGSPYSFQNDNSFIPRGASDDDDSGTPQQGRQVLFETTIIASPVLRSSRLRSGRRALSGAALNAVTGMADQLHGDGAAAGAPASSNTTTTAHRSTSTTTDQDDADDLADLLTGLSIVGGGGASNNTMTTTAASTPPPSPAVPGRYEDYVFSPKTKQRVLVKRSARFLHNKGE